jgi:hypothetical protein
MKRFAALLVALMALCGGIGVQAQQIGGAGFSPGGGGSGSTAFVGSCAASTAFVNRAFFAPASQRSAWDTFICGGVTDGWWAKMDVVQLYAANSAGNGLLNLVAPTFGARMVNTPTFTVGAGINPIFQVAGGGPSYIDTGFNPSTAAGNFTQDSAHISVCSIEQGGGQYAYSILNNFAATSNLNIFGKNGGDTYARTNDASAAGYANAGSTTGFFGGNRSGASAEQTYVGGSLVGSPNGTSAAIQNNNIWLGAANSSGNLIGAYDGLVLAFTAGGNLSSTDWTNLYSRISTYMNTVHGSSC